MERIIFSIILLIAIQSINAQIKSEVNECFELTSIVFRLAEANEYVNNGLKVYTNDIDRYFLKHKEHQLIAFAKEIRMKHRIGYDAVSTADKRYLLNRYHNYGFIWMERSLAFMEYFRNYRHLFPTVEDYMPQIVEFINYTANNIEHVLKEYTNRAPYIVEIFPAQGSTINFDVDTIKMRFSEPMHGAHGTMLVDDEKINPIPFSAMPSWENEDKLVYIIPLDKNKLEIGKTYGIKLNSQYFQSGKTYPMKEDFIYTFKVAEK